MLPLLWQGMVTDSHGEGVKLEEVRQARHRPDEVAAE